MATKPDDVVLQRENLLLTSRLVIKGLLESCMKGKNRMLTSDHRQLQDFFILIEKVLLHGLKAPKTLLTFKSPEDLLWAMVQKVGKLTKEAEESVTCIQQLPYVKSSIARVRSWLRLAVMQKKLSDYFHSLVESREILREFYESWSVLRNENSGIIFAGSLIGLRVIDCNLYLKEEELAKQCSEIDLNLYVKIPSLPSEEMVEADNNNSEMKTAMMSEGEIKSILDQKNYLEERNRALSARVESLVGRLDVLESMRKHNKMGNSEEFLVIPDSAVSTGGGDSTSIGSGSLPNDQLSQQVARLEEMEMAMSLMEKDVHEKQDTIVSLRQQIEDVKKINLDLYQKLRTAEESNKQKDRYILTLENEQIAAKDSVKIFQEKVIEMESAMIKRETFQLRLEAEVREKTEFCASLQAELADLKNQYRTLETEAAAETAEKLDLLTEIASARTSNQKYQSLKARYDLVELKMREYEVTLEEMGVHLEESKLKAEDLKESAVGFLEAQWADDKDVKECQKCAKVFSYINRKHHCRSCGSIFCESCSDNKIALPSSAKPVRVCDLCYETLLKKRYSAMKPD